VRRTTVAYAATNANVRRAMRRGNGIHHDGEPLLLQVKGGDCRAREIEEIHYNLALRIR
jgi:hypothetical protein